MEQPRIFLITGIMAAGKSTVAQALAERLPKSVHVRGDVFRRMIISGRKEMTVDYDDEALVQLRLRYRLAAQTAHAYCAAGFYAVCQDIIIGEMLREVVDLYRLGGYPVYLTVLCPTVEAVLVRDAGRDKVAYRDWTPDMLDRELRESTPRLGLWLDTSALTVAQTVDTIWARLAEAAI